MSDPVELTIVIPVKDEQDAVGPFVARIVPVIEAIDDPVSRHFELLFIDDGSTDGTLDRLRELHARHRQVKALSLSRNFGKEAALSAGLDHAAGKAVIPLDVDLQDPPEVIATMVAKWREGFDVVYGVRVNRKSDSLSKRLTADLYYRSHNWLSSDKIPEHAGDFRLLDRKVVDVIRQMPERNRFMKGLFAWAGFRQAAVDYHRVERAHGTSKFNYWKLWTLALDGITSASTVPLRVWSYLGGTVALAALLYAVVIVIRTLAFGSEVPGYASMMVAILFLGGLQLLSLGIVGEYVGRILIETKARPLYVVRETIGD
jgi:glycosyltransferase involved in cell wall biosynthesis